MRAGSLSDPRVVALLRKYFVSVEMTELSTKHLIADPADVALLEKYGKVAGEKRLGSNFHAGEREAFFTPKGMLVDVFLTLHCGTATREWNGHKYSGQYCQSERTQPKAAVRRWFRSAAKVLKRSHGRLPADFSAFRRGTAPEVAAVRAMRPSLPAAGGDGKRLDLRVQVRADVVMYEQLVGSELVQLSARDARRLLPDELTAGARQRWPAASFFRVLRLAYPRGAGVHVQLDRGSVTGSVETEVVAVSDTEVTGRLRGAFRLEPQTDGERSQRSSYKPWRWTAAQLVGDFRWDRAQRRFTRLRLVSEQGRSAFKHGKKRENPYRLGIELASRRVRR